MADQPQPEVMAGNCEDCNFLTGAFERKLDQENLSQSLKGLVKYEEHCKAYTAPEPSPHKAQWAASDMLVPEMV